MSDLPLSAHAPQIAIHAETYVIGHYPCAKEMRAVRLVSWSNDFAEGNALKVNLLFHAFTLSVWFRLSDLNAVGIDFTKVRRHDLRYTYEVDEIDSNRMRLTGIIVETADHDLLHIRCFSTKAGLGLA